MAKDVSIKKDGVVQEYDGAKRIKTHDIDGNTTLWMPMSETKTGTRKINKNGTYKASDDGFYGYSKVVVSASKNAVGKKPDGKTYKVDVDDNGNLVETLIPDRIKITTNPTKTSYSDGEEIDLTGAVVKAYTDATTVWDADGYSGGVIPHSELSCEPNNAEQSGGSNYYNVDIQDVSPWFPSNVSFTVGQSVNFGGTNYVLSKECFITSTKFTINNSTSSIIVIASKTQFTETINGITINAISSSVNGKGFYWINIIGYTENVSPDCGNVGGEASVSPTDSVYKQIAYNMLYGDVSEPNNQEITVEWYRPDDEKKLTDTFNITVSESSSSSSGGGSW